MIRLLAGDARDVLATLAAESVHTVVTSPPYYGLRDYGTTLWDGGDAACDHAFSMSRHSGLAAAAERCDGNTRNASGPIFAKAPQQAWHTCGKCGATRVDRQIGLEATPDAYLATMVGVFREVRRVLRPDGTCWVNMGDSYATQPAGNFGGAKRGVGPFDTYRSNISLDTTKHAKPKDLLMMPARLALALQADGWWVRSAIVWAKPNPMPESVSDRPTSAYEMVYLLTKSARYFYDNDAIAEPALRAGDVPGGTGGFIDHMTGGHNKDGLAANGQRPVAATRACRNVWTIATAPYSEAHFATYPPALAERCIRAGTSERGCCGQCGKPWVRKLKDVETTGWRAGCEHEAPTIPCTVLDPFIGAGTTALVADRLQRDCIGVDLNTSYATMALDRCRADAPLFVDADLGPVPEHPVETEIADLFAEAAE